MLENLIEQHLTDLRARDLERLEKERLSNEQKIQVIEFALYTLKKYVGLDENNPDFEIRETTNVPEGFAISFNVSYKNSRAVTIKSNQVLRRGTKLGNYYLSDSLEGVMIEDTYANNSEEAKKALALQLAKYYHTSNKIKESLQ